MEQCIQKQVRFRRGLSHFEMMIVISVILVIVAIFIPVLRQAKKQGEQTHCLGNERQLMTAWYNYTIDYDDRLCIADDFIPSLLPYTQSEDVFYCVSVKDPWVAISEYSVSSDPNEEEKQDGVRRDLNLVSHSDYVDRDYGLQYKSCYAISNTMGGVYRDGVLPYYKYQEVKEMSRRLVFIDIDPLAGPTFWPIVQSDTGWGWRPRNWPPTLQGLTARHSGGVSAVFADGHGESINWDIPTLNYINSFENSYTSAAPPESKLSDDLQKMVDMLGRD